MRLHSVQNDIYKCNIIHTVRVMVYTNFPRALKFYYVVFCTRATQTIKNNLGTFASVKGNTEGKRCKVRYEEGFLIYEEMREYLIM